MDVLDSGTMMSLNDEKKKLEAQLAGISKLEDRLKEVNVLLGNIIYKKLSFAIDFWTDLLIFIGESGNGHNYEDDEKEDDIE